MTTRGNASWQLKRRRRKRALKLSYKSTNLDHSHLISSHIVSCSIVRSPDELLAVRCCRCEFALDCVFGGVVERSPSNAAYLVRVAHAVVFKWLAGRFVQLLSSEDETLSVDHDAQLLRDRLHQIGHERLGIIWHQYLLKDGEFLHNCIYAIKIQARDKSNRIAKCAHFNLLHECRHRNRFEVS